MLKVQQQQVCHGQPLEAVAAFSRFSCAPSKALHPGSQGLWPLELASAWDLEDVSLKHSTAVCLGFSPVAHISKGNRPPTMLPLPQHCNEAL